ncbi:Hydroxysteroid dehydrogenase, partial [Monkeypox virus]
ERTR